MAGIQRLDTVDYIVLAGMLAISLGIGIYFAIRGKETKEAYLLGGRQMGVWSVSISMFVTLQSAISLLGTPAEVYTFGTMFLYLYLGASLVYIIGLYTCLPLLYPLRLTSVYEYFEMRFESKAVRLLGTAIGMLQTVAYMSVALLSPGLALQAVAGLPLWWSIVIVGLVGTLYTSIGGIKSVVWTDVFQSMVMLGGIIAVITLGGMRAGGAMNVIRIAHKEGRIDFDEIDPDPRVRHTVWSLVIGGFFNWYPALISQSMVQRISAVKSLSAGRITYLLNAPMVFIYGLVLTVTGLVLYSYMYTIGCDPYESGHITNRNQLMPYFVMHVLSSLPGVTGLYMSMLFSGALSTLSSGINALAANTVEDVLGPSLTRARASEKVTTVIAKLAVCFYGLLSIGLAYGARAMHGPVTQISLAAFGACGGPLLGMFMLGAVFTFTNKTGVLAGGISALAINIWISISGQIYGRHPQTLDPAPTYACFEENTVLNMTTPLVYTNTSIATEMSTVPMTNSLSDLKFDVSDISYLWYGLIGMLVAIIVGVLVSLITGRRNSATLDPQLVFPFVRRICKLKEPYTPAHTLVSSAQYRAMTNYRFSWDMFKLSSPPYDELNFETKNL